MDDIRLGPIAGESVEFNGKKFWVSTVNRESSSMIYGIYAETMVFDENSKIVGQDEHSANSTLAHHRMVRRIAQTGQCYDTEDE